MTDREPSSDAREQGTYGTAEHAAREALAESLHAHEGWVNASVEDAAKVVVEGLRQRGFMVANEPRCECGWTGEHNHYHDMRMGRADAK